MYCWGLATSVGMEAQVKALAAALDVQVQMRGLSIKPPFVWLPNACYAAGLNRFVIPGMLAPGYKALGSPWPDLVISCGRRSAIAALGLKHYIANQKAGSDMPPTRFIHIQDPQISPHHFDAVIAMEHDRITGDNVLHMRYALHSITQQKLAEGAAQHAELFARYKRPYVAVLLGGSTNKYSLTREAMSQVIDKLRLMLSSMEGSLLITVSRRTGDDNIQLLKDVFFENNRVYIYDGTGTNPYVGLLGLADSLVVSNDSVNMMTEAAATGKPLYLLMLPGHSNTKPAQFSEKLVNDGVARLWGNSWDSWSYDINSEMQELPKKIKNMLNIF